MDGLPIAGLADHLIGHQGGVDDGSELFGPVVVGDIIPFNHQSRQIQTIAVIDDFGGADAVHFQEPTGRDISLGGVTDESGQFQYTITTLCSVYVILSGIQVGTECQTLAQECNQVQQGDKFTAFNKVIEIFGIIQTQVFHHALAQSLIVITLEVCISKGLI